MIIGYARVSTTDQNLYLQIQAIKEYAKEKGEEFRVYHEKESTRKNRPELKAALDNLRSGDTLVIYKLDRLARSTKELFNIVEDLEDRNIQFVSVTDNLDTTTSTGKAMFGMLAVFAEFERSMIRERTIAGLAAARERGKVGGRPITSEATKRRVKALYASGESATDIAKDQGIGRSTVYKILKEEG